MSKAGTQRHLDLILNSDEVLALSQMIQALAESEGIGASIFSPSYERMVGPSNHCSYCELITRSEKGWEACRKCDRSHFPQSGETVREYECHAGLLDFSVPIVVKGQVIGAIFGGQMRGSDLSRRDFVKLRRVAKRCGMDELLLYEAASRIRVRTQGEVDSVIRLTEGIAATIANLVERRVREHEFLLALTKPPSPNDLAALIVDYVRESLTADACSIFLRQPAGSASAEGKVTEGETLVLRSTSSEYLREHVGSAFYPLGVGLTGWVGKTGKPLRIDYVHDKSELLKISRKLSWAARYPETEDKDDVERFLAIPLISVSSRKPIGVLRAIRTAGKPAFTIPDLATLQGLARLIVSAIENAQHQEDASRRTKELEALGNAARSLNRGLDWHQTLAIIIKEGLRVMDHVAGVSLYVLQHSREREEFTLVAGGGAGFHESHIGRRFLDQEGLAARVLKERAPYVCPDTSTDRYYKDVVSGLRSALVVPIRVGYDIVGTLSLGSLEVNAFKEEEKQILVKFAEHVGVALHNTHLYELARLPIDILDAAVKGLSVLVRWEDLEGLITEEIVQATCRELHATACSLFMLEEDKLFLSASTDEGLCHKLRKANKPANRPAYRIGQGLTGGVAGLRKPVRIDDVTDVHQVDRYEGLKHENLHPELALKDEKTWKSFLGVPIEFQGELHGVLRLSRSSDDRPFWKDEEDLLVAIAHQVALALRFVGTIRDRELVIRRFSHDAGDPILHLDAAFNSYYNSCSDDEKARLLSTDCYIKHFKRLVNTYVTIGRPEAVRVGVVSAFRPFGTIECILKILRDLRRRKARDAVFANSISADVEIEADESQVHVMLYNILNNAVVACNRNVDVSLRDEGRYWVFLVTDDGTGFEWNSHEPARRDLHHGLGIVESLAKAHGGFFEARLGDTGGTVARLAIRKEQKNTSDRHSR
jgi:GAF domain-containing protein/ligand-binding sensor protein